MNHFLDFLSSLKSSDIKIPIPHATVYTFIGKSPGYSDTIGAATTNTLAIKLHTLIAET